MFSNAPRSVSAINPILSTSAHNQKGGLALQTSGKQRLFSVPKDSILILELHKKNILNCKIYYK